MGIIDSKTGKEKKYSAQEIKKTANEGRAHTLMAISFAGSGHPGGALSMIDYLATLYFNVLRHDPTNPNWPERDRLFLSAQHKCPAQYALLGLAGYYPVEDFTTGLRVLGTPFQGHPDWRKCKGIEMSGGSLGQGLSIAVGDALAARLDCAPHRVYCVMGDGEQQEGSIWEAAMAAGHYKLDNLCAVVDVNGLQIDGKTCDVMTVEPVAEKYRAFGWHAIECDGHDVDALIKAFETAAKTKGKPTVIVAKTVKGKGVSFMENKAEWHGKAQTAEQTKAALKELGLEALYTPEIERKAKELRAHVARQYGNLILPEERPFWWNQHPDPTHEHAMRADMKPSRFGFGECLDAEGGDPRVVCLGADISGSICILNFCKKHDDRKPRFFSMGIAEQNMTTVAAGLAKEGKIPVIGSYAVFSTGRNWDQIRTTVCYGNLNVKIAVGHGGVSVGPDGATHQALEDITIMSIIPNMTVLVPCDAIEAYKATHAGIFEVTGPVAMRFAREATPVVTKPDYPFKVGEANVFRFLGEKQKFVDAFDCVPASEYESADGGDKVAIIACGPEVPEALRAAWILKKQHGVSARVVNMHTIKPIDEEAILDAANECDVIVTAEEHQAGGLGNLVAGVIARSAHVSKRPRMAMVGVHDQFGETGQPWELIWKFGLAGEHIAKAALGLLKK